MTGKLKASTPSNLGAHSATHADPSNAEHALAGIKAWNQLLVARGNRLLELAMREREALAGRNASVGSLKARTHSDRRVA
jgi:hypothetical protein